MSLEMILRRPRLLVNPANAWSVAPSWSCQSCRGRHSSSRPVRSKGPSNAPPSRPAPASQSQSQDESPSAPHKPVLDAATERDFLRGFLDTRERLSGPVTASQVYAHPKIRALAYEYDTQAAERKAFEALATALYPLAIEEQVRPMLQEEIQESEYITPQERFKGLLDSLPFFGRRGQHGELSALMKWARSGEWLTCTPMGARAQELQELLAKARAEDPYDAAKVEHYQTLYDREFGAYSVDPGHFYTSAHHSDLVSSLRKAVDPEDGLQQEDFEPEHCYRILGADYEVKHERVLWPVWDVTGSIIVPCTSKRDDAGKGNIGVKSADAYIRFRRGMLPAHISDEKAWLSYIPLDLPQPPFSKKRCGVNEKPTDLAVRVAHARLSDPNPAYANHWRTTRLPFSLSAQSLLDAWAKKLKTFTASRPERRILFSPDAPKYAGLVDRGLAHFRLAASEYTFRLEDAKFEHLSASPLVLPLYASTFTHRRHGTGERCTTVVVQSGWDSSAIPLVAPFTADQRKGVHWRRVIEESSEMAHPGGFAVPLRFSKHVFYPMYPLPLSSETESTLDKEKKADREAMYKLTERIRRGGLEYEDYDRQYEEQDKERHKFLNALSCAEEDLAEVELNEIVDNLLLDDLKDGAWNPSDMSIFFEAMVLERAKAARKFPTNLARIRSMAQKDAQAQVQEEARKLYEYLEADPESRIFKPKARRRANAGASSPKKPAKAKRSQRRSMSTSSTLGRDSWRETPIGRRVFSSSASLSKANKTLDTFLRQRQQQQRDSSLLGIENRARERLANIKAKETEEQRRIFAQAVTQIDEEVCALRARTQARLIFAERVSTGQIAVPPAQPDTPGGDVVDFDAETVVPYTRQVLLAKVLHQAALIDYMRSRADTTASTRHFGEQFIENRRNDDGTKTKVLSKTVLIEAQQIRDEHLGRARDVARMNPKQGAAFEKAFVKQKERSMAGLLERMLSNAVDVSSHDMEELRRMIGQQPQTRIGQGDEEDEEDDEDDDEDDQGQGTQDGVRQK